MITNNEIKRYSKNTVAHYFIHKNILTAIYGEVRTTTLPLYTYFGL